MRTSHLVATISLVLVSDIVPESLASYSTPSHDVCSYSENLSPEEQRRTLHSSLCQIVDDWTPVGTAQAVGEQSVDENDSDRAIDASFFAWVVSLLLLIVPIGAH